MNAKQRRLVRRGLERIKTEEMAFAMGYDHTYPIAKHVEHLIRGQRWARYGRWCRGRCDRRQVGAYGLRCHCGRKAHTIDGDGPECKLHGTGVPF